MRLTKRLTVCATIIGLSIVSAFTTDLSHAKLTRQAKNRTETVYNVRTFGAKADGKVLDTRAINKTIDAAALAGGATRLAQS